MAGCDFGHLKKGRQTEIIGNNMNHMGYFELFRCLNGWNLKKLVKADEGASE